MERLYKEQRQTSRYLANQMVRLGPAVVKECLIDHPVDDQAPTPETFRAKEKAFSTSGLILDRGSCRGSTLIM